MATIPRTATQDSPSPGQEMTHPRPFSVSCTPADGLNRRDFLSYFSGVGLSGTLLPGVLWARLQEGGEITEATLAEAEKVAGLEFTDEEREAMVRGLNQNLQAYEALRAQPIPNEVPPALHFDPVLPAMELPTEIDPFRPSRVETARSGFGTRSTTEIPSTSRENDCPASKASFACRTRRSPATA